MGFLTLAKIKFVAFFFNLLFHLLLAKDKATNEVALSSGMESRF